MENRAGRGVCVAKTVRVESGNVIFVEWEVGSQHGGRTTGGGTNPEKTF